MKKLLVFLMVTGILVVFTTPLMAQNPQKVFQQGIIQEEGEGNLLKAIEIYNSLVDDVSIARDIRAKALLRVGNCYEKLGENKAKEAYQKLITEFKDQPKIAAIASTKLKTFAKSGNLAKNVGIRATLISSAPIDCYGISPDGRYLNAINWDAIAIEVKDLQSGKSRMITKQGTWKPPMEFPDMSIWSPDGKKLAYYWYKGESTELHIVNLDGTNDRILVSEKDRSAPWPVTWTPDGNSIVTITEIKLFDQSKISIDLIDVNDGSKRELKTVTGVDCGCNMKVSPDGKYLAYSYFENEFLQNTHINILAMDGSSDESLIIDASTNNNPIWSNDGKSILFLSDRFGSMDLWKVKMKKGKPIGDPYRVKSNLGEYSRLLGLTNDHGLYYKVTNVRTDVFYQSLNANSEKQNNTPVKLSHPSDKRNGSSFWSPDGRYITYLNVPYFRDPNMGWEYQFIVYDTETGKSSFKDLGIFGHPNSSSDRPSYSPDGKSILVNGRTREGLQGVFAIDLETHVKHRINVRSDLSIMELDRSGFNQTLSNDGKSLYFMTPDRKQIIKRNVTSKDESVIYEDTEELLYFKVSNDNKQIAFSYFFTNQNDLYVIDADSGRKKKIHQTADNTVPRVIGWSTDDAHLFFQKGESDDIKQIMRIAVKGGTPETYINFKDFTTQGRVVDAQLSRDGSRVAYTLGRGTGDEIWRLDGVVEQ